MRAHGLLFTLDEVQSSFGRTGKFFAMEWEGLQPDLVCIGKGIGSGMPASAIGARSEVIGALGTGEMSSTHGRQPGVLRGGRRRGRHHASGKSWWRTRCAWAR